MKHPKIVIHQVDPDDPDNNSIYAANGENLNPVDGHRDITDTERAVDDLRNPHLTIEVVE